MNERGGESALYRAFVENGPVTRIIVHDSEFWRELRQEASNASAVRILSRAEEEMATQEAEAFFRPLLEQLPDPFYIEGDDQPHHPRELTFRLERALSYLLIGNKFKAGVLEAQILSDPSGAIGIIDSNRGIFDENGLERVDLLKSLLGAYRTWNVDRLTPKEGFSGFDEVLELVADSMVSELSELNHFLGLVRYRAKEILAKIKRAVRSILESGRFNYLATTATQVAFAAPDSTAKGYLMGASGLVNAIQGLDLRSFAPPIERLDVFSLGTSDAEFTYQDFNYAIPLYDTSQGLRNVTAELRKGRIVKGDEEGSQSPKSLPSATIHPSRSTIFRKSR